MYCLGVQRQGQGSAFRFPLFTQTCLKQLNIFACTLFKDNLVKLERTRQR